MTAPLSILDSPVTRLDVPTRMTKLAVLRRLRDLSAYQGTIFLDTENAHRLWVVVPVDRLRIDLGHTLRTGLLFQRTTIREALGGGS